MKSIIKNVLIFYEKKDEYENSIEYLKIINFVIKKKYYEEIKILLMKRIMLRKQFKDEVLK